jgi:hypothetical protein
MEIKQWVETIAREIVSAMSPEALTESAKQPRVLYVFSDSTQHEAYSDHFITLNNHQIAFDFMYLDGETSAWLGKHRIESAGPGKVIALDEYAPAPIEVPLEYDGIVIPEIDLDTIGRAALGIRGTVLSEVIFAALVTGKFVLVGEDVSGLKRADRRTLKTLTMPEPYRKLFDYYKQELQMYGASFGLRTELAEMAVARCRSVTMAPRHAEAERMEDKPSAQAMAGTVTQRFDGTLVTAEWVSQAWNRKPFSRLVVASGTRLTPLALDALRAHGITVEHGE